MRVLGRVAAVLAVALLTSCGGYQSDIDAVKKAEAAPGTTNEAWVNDIAGARGHVEWSAGKAAAYNSDDIVEVVAAIDKPAASGGSHKIELHFIHNRQTQKVALDNVFVDGKSQGLLGGALNLLLLQLQ